MENKINYSEKYETILGTPDPQGKVHITFPKIKAIAKEAMEQIGYLNAAKLCLQRVHEEEASNKRLKQYYSYDGKNEESLDKEGIEADMEDVIIDLVEAAKEEERLKEEDRLDAIKNDTAREVRALPEEEKEKLKKELEETAQKIDKREITWATTEERPIEVILAEFFGAIDGLYLN